MRISDLKRKTRAQVIGFTIVGLTERHNATLETARSFAASANFAAAQTALTIEATKAGGGSGATPAFFAAAFR